MGETATASDQPTDRLAVVVSQIGKPGFDSALLSMFQVLSRSDNAAIFFYGRSRKPRYIAAVGTGDDYMARIKPYLAGTYVLDPFHIRSRTLSKPALLRMVDIAPQDFEDSAYFVSYYKHSNILDEINFLVPLEPGRVFALCLIRSTGSRAFGPQELKNLHRWLAPLTELIKRHADICGGLFPPDSAGATCDEAELGEIFADFAIRDLTPREREVVLLILEGTAPGDIAAQLGVSIETIRVHRRNIYDKLSISSLAELFGLALRHVVQQTTPDQTTNSTSVRAVRDQS